MGDRDKLSDLAPCRQLTPRPAMGQRPQVKQRPEPDGSLNLVELFTSLQGEGPSIGEPVTFLRLALCNLKCVWCDTDYRSKAKLPVEDVAIELMERFRDKPGKAHIIITGGEPTIQAPQLCRLVDLCREQAPRTRWQFDCESNGHWLDGASLGFYRRMDQVILSPKPPSSKNPPFDWLGLYAVLAADPDLAAKTYLKPVIMDDEDWAWLKMAAELTDRPLEVPIIMQTYVDPDGDGLADFRGYWREFLTPERIEWMRQYNVRLLPRLHNLIWSNEQGF